MRLIRNLPRRFSMAAMQTITLSNGAHMPSFGLGTWQSEKGKAGAAVKHALEQGYRLIDCAHVYQNEAEIGDFMAEVFKKGTVAREDVFVVSKLWCKDFAKEHVVPACELTLKNLKLEYLDLYLLHLPFRLEFSENIKLPPAGTGKGLIGYSPEMLKETWQQMEALVERGLCKAIGISNFTAKKTKDLLEFAKIKPACNQVELHPYLPQEALREYSKKNGIAMLAYSPLGTPARPEMFKSSSDPVLMEDPTVKEVAHKHSCSVAQVLIKWGIQNGFGVIPKSVTPSRIEENIKALDVTLDDDDMGKLNSISTRHRFCTQAWALRPNETFDELWDAEYLL